MKQRRMLRVPAAGCDGLHLRRQRNRLVVLLLLRLLRLQRFGFGGAVVDAAELDDGLQLLGVRQRLPCAPTKIQPPKHDSESTGLRGSHTCPCRPPPAC